MSAYTRANVSERVLTAVFGSYFLSSLWAIGVSVLLPIPKHEAVFIATMTTFLVFPVIVIWSFYCQSLKRLLAGVIGLGSIASLILVIAQALMEVAA